MLALSIDFVNLSARRLSRERGVFKRQKKSVRMPGFAELNAFAISNTFRYESLRKALTMFTIRVNRCLSIAQAQASVLEQNILDILRINPPNYAR
jgi:hypothetical protein